MLVYVFEKQKQTIGSFLLATLGELPSLFLNLCLIDREGFGRKNVVIINFVLGGICFVIFSFATITGVASLNRFVIKNLFQMLYPLTTESYSSLNRALGFGFNSGMGRIAITIMPFIVVPLAKWHLQ